MAAAAGARVSFSRLAVQGAYAAAVMAALTDSGPEEGSTVEGEDLFVRGVRPQVVRVIPTTAPVAYGLHAGTGCQLSAQRFVVDDGGYGFFHALASMTLREGVVSGQRDAAGASNGASAEHPLTLDGVSLEGNARDDIVRDVKLPEASLPAPTAPCETPGAC